MCRHTQLDLRDFLSLRASYHERPSKGADSCAMTEILPAVASSVRARSSKESFTEQRGEAKKRNSSASKRARACRLSPFNGPRSPHECQHFLSKPEQKGRSRRQSTRASGKRCQQTSTMGSRRSADVRRGWTERFRKFTGENKHKKSWGVFALSPILICLRMNTT